VLDDASFQGDVFTAEDCTDDAASGVGFEGTVDADDVVDFDDAASGEAVDIDGDGAFEGDEHGWCYTV
jgi:hypothetical protein